MQSFAQILTDTYSSTSTCEAAAWIETWSGSNRSKGQKTSQPLNNNNNNNNKISLWAVIISSPDSGVGVILLPLLQHSVGSSGRFLLDFSRAAALPLPQAHCAAPALNTMKPSLSVGAARTPSSGKCQLSTTACWKKESLICSGTSPAGTQLCCPQLR